MKHIYFDSDEAPYPGDVLAPVSTRTNQPTRYYRIAAVRLVRRVSRASTTPRWNLDVYDEPEPVRLQDGERMRFMWWYPRRRTRPQGPGEWRPGRKGPA